MGPKKRCLLNCIPDVLGLGVEPRPGEARGVVLHVPLLALQLLLVGSEQNEIVLLASRLRGFDSIEQLHVMLHSNFVVKNRNK